MGPGVVMMDHMESAESRLRLRGEALQWREIEGEMIALEERTATYLAANPAGTLLWRTLAGGTTRSELVSALVEQYGIDETRAAGDVDSFLRELTAQGLLDEVS